MLSWTLFAVYFCVFIYFIDSTSSFVCIVFDFLNESIYCIYCFFIFFRRFHRNKERKKMFMLFVGKQCDYCQSDMFTKNHRTNRKINWIRDDIPLFLPNSFLFRCCVAITNYYIKTTSNEWVEWFWHRVQCDTNEMGRAWNSKSWIIRAFVSRKREIARLSTKRILRFFLSVHCEVTQ